MGDENEMEVVEIVGEIFSIREANVAMSIAMALFLISSGSNLYSWTQTEYDLARDAATDDQWLIEFNVSVSTTRFRFQWHHIRPDCPM